MSGKYLGFEKLKAKIAKGGAKNPAGVAAAVMHKKYKEKDIKKHQESGTSMEHVKPKKEFK